MKKFQMNDLDQFVSQASQALADSQTILQEVLDEANITTSSDDSTAHEVQIIQLILQYRLDTQDALLKLLHIDHGLLQILGIGPQHSSRVNLERMEFALGNDDLHHILYSLSQLVHSLLRVAHRYQQHTNTVSAQKQSQASLRATASRTTLAARLQKAVVLQKLVISLTTEMSNTLNQWNEIEPMGPILNHIAVFRGSMSQLFLVLQNGLELSHNLYEKECINTQLVNTLDTLLHQAESVLKHIPPAYEPQHFFTPVKDDIMEQLEKRAF